MDSRFAECLFNAEHRVLGYQLQPLSAAHLVTLEELVPVLMEGGTFLPEELLLAVKICASPVELIQGVYLPGWRSALRLTWRDKMRLFKMRVRKTFEHASQAYAAYWSDYMSMPVLGGTLEGFGQLLTAPQILARVTKVIPLVGEQRAWSMPFGVLVWMSDTHDELQGAPIRFEPDEEQASVIDSELAEVDRLGAEFEAQLKAKKGGDHG